MSSVFLHRAEGLTRAWPIVAVDEQKHQADPEQAMISGR